uniref:Elicitin n=1 Tax=Hyaloperonospora arabidopsidis TaxID=272952 RepID=F6MEX2_HYAAB|nr:elicitin-like protein [Hyaloperonospora arabidopsidis]
MNTHFAIAAIALAVATSVNGQGDCSPEVTKAAYTSMSSLLKRAELMSCGDRSHYNFMTAEQPANHEQELAMCGVAECHTLIAEVKELNPPDCVISIPGRFPINIKAMADAFEGKCKSPNPARSAIEEPTESAMLTAAAPSPDVSEETDVIQQDNDFTEKNTTAYTPGKVLDPFTF